MTIFIITSVFINEKIPLKEFRHTRDNYCSRPWGYFPTYQEVLYYLKKDEFNIEECLYNYVVVEEFLFGIPAMCLNQDNKDSGQKWFRIGKGKSKWVRCKRPEQMRGTINFGLG